MGTSFEGTDDTKSIRDMLHGAGTKLTCGVPGERDTLVGAPVRNAAEVMSRLPKDAEKTYDAAKHTLHVTLKLPMTAASATKP